MINLLLAIIYMAFVSLGLPDALLGSAWPVMYREFGVPVSYAGIISTIIAASTVVSSLQSDRMTKRFGTGKIMVVSVAMTAVALAGFSVSNSYWPLCVIAIPYGLGAGNVDASLNNYVALHYASRHMSWLHCMWGLGASIGPYIMGYALTGGQGWQSGYRYIVWIQIALTVILMLALPLWKRAFPTQKAVDTGSGKDGEKEKEKQEKILSLKEIFAINGAKEIMLMFFCYCAIEQTAGLWASSYLTLGKNVLPEIAAGFASMFFYGITAGRAVSGFLTIRFDDKTMIRMGESLIAAGILLLFLPFGEKAALAGLIMTGVGCAPIYPCVIHSTPEYFGADKSQAVIGVQMACAYVGICLMPPVFGVLAEYVSIHLFPVYLLVLLGLMFWMHERLQRKHSGSL